MGRLVQADLLAGSSSGNHLDWAMDHLHTDFLDGSGQFQVVGHPSIGGG